MTFQALGTWVCRPGGVKGGFERTTIFFGGWAIRWILIAFLLALPRKASYRRGGVAIDMHLATLIRTKHEPRMDETDPMKPLDPAYVEVMRIVAAVFCVILLIVALIFAIANPTVPGVIFIPAVMIFSVWWVGMVPSRRYARWRYSLGVDRLRIERGYLFYTDTVVPLGRIQHIDVEQGPLLRRYGLATLTVHTAGSHGASVSLPGLRHDEAVAMRERIRAYIKAAQR